MKVLQICSKPPLPAIDGGCMAMSNITKGLLQNGVEVKVLTLATHKHPFIEQAYSKEYVQKTAIEYTSIDTRVKFFPAFFNLFSLSSYNINRFYTLRFKALILDAIKKNEYDVVFLEGLYVSGYLAEIKSKTSAKVIYRAHNVESEIWERNAENEKGIKKWYLKLLASRLKKYERGVINQFDGIAAITEKDKQNFNALGSTLPIEVFPFGIDINNYKTIESKSNSLFHIGSMDWLPNQEGIKWFLDKVWVEVVKINPNIQFELAGKGMPHSLLNHHQKNVNIIGEVDDAIDFINQNSIMVVPLFAGSGMRIKIIEAMALQKVVIATSIAAEGIACESGKNIIIADSAKEFLDAIELCLNNGELVAEMGRNAKIMVASHYDNKVIVNNLVEFFKQII